MNFKIKWENASFTVNEILKVEQTFPSNAAERQYAIKHYWSDWNRMRSSVHAQEQVCICIASEAKIWSAVKKCSEEASSPQENSQRQTDIPLRTGVK